MRKRNRFLVLVATVAAISVVATAAISATSPFVDVPESSTFVEDVAWLAENGVTRGCNPPDNTRFCPEDPVTRQQLAAFLHRFANTLPQPTHPTGPVDSGTESAVQGVNRTSSFGSDNSAVTSSDGPLTVGTLTLDPAEGRFAALSASLYSVAVESDADLPGTEEPMALTIGWIQEGGNACSPIPLGGDGPEPPSGLVGGSEFPLVQGSFGPAAGSVTVGFELGDDPVIVRLCAAVLPIFGNEVVEIGSGGFTAVQSANGTFNEYTP